MGVAFYAIVAGGLIAGVVFFVIDVAAFHRENRPVEPQPVTVIKDIDRAWGRAAFDWRDEWETPDWPSTRTPSCSPSCDSPRLTSDATTSDSPKPTPDATDSSVQRRNLGWRIVSSAQRQA